MQEIFNAPATAPDLRVAKLLFVVSGSVQAASAPAWLLWLRSTYKNIQVRVVVTRTALRFVTMEALSAVGQCDVQIDAWSDDSGHALHVELATWAEAIIVHPATMDFIARYAVGLGNSPALLAMQCTDASIVVCPAVPPGAEHNPALRRNISELSARENVVVMPCLPGVSLSSNTPGIGAVAMLPYAVKALEELRFSRQEADE
ncbi:flavoprotein [Nocardia amamiensis]|uniref:flavoprotein n=1 Tax=Nocardia amamiensis TaxID=404578 RepID=UPI0033FE3BEB